MARQPRTRQPKAKFTPRCVKCWSPYHRYLNKDGKLVTEQTCRCN